MFIKDPNDNDSVNTDSSRIANVVNDHFASIGLKLSNKLLTVQRNYFYFMNGSNSSDSSSAFNLVTPEEVELEILRIPNNKSHGLYSVSCPSVEALVKSCKQYTRGNSPFGLANVSLN